MNRRPEHGSVTAFLAVFMVAFLALAGLVLDGGLALAAKRRAVNEAHAAARAGAAAVSSGALRTQGTFTLDPERAHQVATDYLAFTGHQGTVAVEGDTVSVTVSWRQPVALLGIVGVRSVAVTGRGRARIVHGVAEEE